MKQQKRYFGYIFKINKSGTDDKVINIISTNGSRVSALSKGARKQNSKKANSINLGNYVEIKVVEGYAVPILSDIKVVREFKYDKENLQLIFYLQLICEVLNHFVYEEEEQDFFKITKFTLDRIYNEDILTLIVIFTLKLLIYSGNLPKLNESILNGTDITSENAYFAENSIGYVSENIDEYRITPRVYKIQRFMEKYSIEDCLKLKVDPKESKILLNIQLDWIEILFQKELKSRKLIRF